jgi:competence protein ComEC
VIAVGSQGESSSVATRWVDLRLAGPAVAAWLAALAGLHLGARFILLAALVATALAVIGFLAAARGGGRRYGWIGVTLLLGVVCGGTATGARLLVRDAAPLAELVRRQGGVTAELVVRDDPRALDRVVAGPPTYLVRATLVRARAENGPEVSLPARILVLAADPGWRGLLPGQRLVAAGRLEPPRGGDLTAAVLIVRQAPTLIGAPSWLQRAAGELRAGLQRACAPLPDEPGGLLPGLVVGDVSRLVPEVEADFLATGMTHLTAVSGSNVALVVGLVLLLARWARAGPWLAAGLCGLALIGFVILVRPSPSVLRAATMGAIGLAALAVGRPRAAVPALTTAVVVLVVVDPALAADAGFALSVLATGGLLLIAPGWRDGLRRRGVPAGVAEALAVPAAAQLAGGGRPLRHGEPGRGAGQPAGDTGDRPGHRVGRGRGGALPGLADRGGVRGLARALAGLVVGAGGPVRRAGAGRDAAVVRRGGRRDLPRRSHRAAAARRPAPDRPTVARRDRGGAARRHRGGTGGGAGLAAAGLGAGGLRGGPG